MTDDIILAKKELFNQLRGYNEVVGASIRRSNGQKYIVILLTRLTNQIKSRIPTTYRGNIVTHEVIGQVRAL